MSLSFDMDRYFREIRFFIKRHWLPLLVSCLLVVVPFFWFKPGELNIGGDGGRLYFYDPIHILTYLTSYFIMPFGTGSVSPLFHYLPLVLILAFLKSFVNFPYILIALYSSMKIVISFLAVYGIVSEFIGIKNKEDKSTTLVRKIASILGGLFYVFNPAMTENYVRALPSHDQVFLNPLIFYFILRYMNSTKLRYLFFSLLTSVIFSHNFQTSAAPPFFAFYPLALLFLFLYKVIDKIKVSWSNLLWMGVLFIGLHAFHIFPEFSDFFTLGSNINFQVFDKANAAEMLSYFFGVMPYTKVSFHWLAFSSWSQFGGLTLLIPMVCIIGLLLNSKKEKLPLLTGVFFLVTLYLVTAQITRLGIVLYQYLFKIPGFTMFKNFYGQWQFVFYFFYSLLFGQAVFLIVKRLKNYYCYVFFFITALFLILNSWLFINGELINQFNTQSDTKVGVIFDPKYEESLKFIRSIPDDGKILVLPFSDSYFQVVHGTNNGAYVGHSMVGQLTGKKDFAGYMDMAPYSDIFWKFSKEQKFLEIIRIFGLLNIQYVYYNSDPLVYDEAFPGFPYSPDYVRKFMPKNQVDYKNYVSKLPLMKLFEQGSYNVYKIYNNFLVPHIYISTQIITYRENPSLSTYDKASSFIGETISSDLRTSYIDSAACKSLMPDTACDVDRPLLQSEIPEIQFQKVNPVKYKVRVYHASNPYFLIFSENFHRSWKIALAKASQGNEDIIGNYFNSQVQELKYKNVFIDTGMLNIDPQKYLKESYHVMANGYANAWYITPQDTFGEQNYELSIEFVGQRLFYGSLLISGIFVFITIGLIVRTIILKKF